MEDEIFGPLLPILTYKDMDAAIREVKKHPKPLSGFLFSRDQKAIDHFLASLSFGGRRDQSGKHSPVYRNHALWRGRIFRHRSLLRQGRV